MFEDDAATKRAKLYMTLTHETTQGADFPLRFLSDAVDEEHPPPHMGKSGSASDFKFVAAFNQLRLFHAVHPPNFFSDYY